MLSAPTAVGLVDRSTRLSSALVTVMLTPPAGAATSRLTLPLVSRFLPSGGPTLRESTGPVTEAVICWRSEGVTNPLGLPVIRRVVVPTPTGWKAAVDRQSSPAAKVTFGAKIGRASCRERVNDTVVAGTPTRSVPTPA